MNRDIESTAFSRRMKMPIRVDEAAIRVDEAEKRSRFYTRHMAYWSSVKHAARPVPSIRSVSESVHQELTTVTEQRSGLCVWKKDDLLLLFENDSLTWGQDTQKNSCADNEVCQIIDETSLAVATSLRKEGFMTKEDIREYNLVSSLLEGRTSLTQKRLQFLIDWDPNCLKETFIGCNLLYQFLFWTVKTAPDTNVTEELKALRDDRLKRFRALFELGMIHFPRQVGWLFQRQNFPIKSKNEPNKSAYQIACSKFGTDVVASVIDQTLSRREFSTIRCSNGSQDQQGIREDTTQALLFAAATDDSTVLDAVFVLLRRDPTAILRTNVSDSGTKGVSINTAAMPRPSRKVKRLPRSRTVWNEFPQNA